MNTRDGPVLFTAPTPPGEVPLADRSIFCFGGCHRIKDGYKCKATCAIAYEAWLEYKLADRKK